MVLNGVLVYLQGGFCMSMNISGLGNAYSGVNTNSKQYKALKEKGWYHGAMEVRTDGEKFTLSVLLIISQQSESISQQVC